MFLILISKISPRSKPSFFVLFFFCCTKLICGLKVCLRDQRVKRRQAKGGGRVCVFSWMGAEATAADLAPGSCGQMGPSGSTIYTSTRVVFFVFFYFKPNCVFSHRRPRLGGSINQTKVTHAGKTPNQVTNLQPGGQGPLQGRECT